MQELSFGLAVFAIRWYCDPSTDQLFACDGSAYRSGLPRLFEAWHLDAICLYGVSESVS